MDSHRAEAMGRVAGFLFLKRYCEYVECNKSRKTIESYCDNKDAVRLAQKGVNPRYSPNTTMRPNWDAFTQVHDIIEELHSVFVLVQPCQHVKAHQDDEKPFHKLSWPAKMNCWADKQATIILNNYEDSE